MKKLHKKGVGVMDGLGALGVGIASLAIVLVVTFLIMAQAKTQIIAIESAPIDSANYNASIAINATNELTNAVATIPPWVPLIVITVIGALILGLVAMFRK